MSASPIGGPKTDPTRFEFETAGLLFVETSSMEDIIKQIQNTKGESKPNVTVEVVHEEQKGGVGKGLKIFKKDGEFHADIILKINVNINDSNREFYYRTFYTAKKNAKNPQVSLVAATNTIKKTACEMIENSLIQSSDTNKLLKSFSNKNNKYTKIKVKFIDGLKHIASIFSKSRRTIEGEDFFSMGETTTIDKEFSKLEDLHKKLRGEGTNKISMSKQIYWGEKPSVIPADDPKQEVQHEQENKSQQRSIEPANNSDLENKSREEPSAASSSVTNVKNKNINTGPSSLTAVTGAELNTLKDNLKYLNNMIAYDPLSSVLSNAKDITRRIESKTKDGEKVITIIQVASEIEKLISNLKQGAKKISEEQKADLKKYMIELIASNLYISVEEFQEKKIDRKRGANYNKDYEKNKTLYENDLIIEVAKKINDVKIKETVAKLKELQNSDKELDQKIQDAEYSELNDIAYAKLMSELNINKQNNKEQISALKNKLRPLVLNHLRDNDYFKKEPESDPININLKNQFLKVLINGVLDLQSIPMIETA